MRANGFAVENMGCPGRDPLDGVPSKKRRKIRLPLIHRGPVGSGIRVQNDRPRNERRGLVCFNVAKTLLKLVWL